MDDGYPNADELIQGERSCTMQRRLTDGTAYRIVKVPLQPVDPRAATRAGRLAYQGSLDAWAVLLGSRNTDMLIGSACLRDVHDGLHRSHG